MRNEWDLYWPGRCEYIARINKYIQPESRLVPDVIAIIAEYGASHKLTWTYPTFIIPNFCPWRDIKPFNHSDFYTIWANRISGIATVNIGCMLIDLLSNHKWYVRSKSSMALSRAYDKFDISTFKTELPPDAYVIYDMSLHGEAAIKNMMRECQNPIALAHHVQIPLTGRVTFMSDVF